MTIKSAIAAACMAAFVSAGSWASAQVDAQLKPEDLATRQLKVAAAAHKSSEAGVEVFLRKEGNATKVVSWRYRRPSSFSRYTLNKSGNELDLHRASGRHLAIRLNCQDGASLQGISVWLVKVDPKGGKQIAELRLIEDAPGYFVSDQLLSLDNPVASFQVRSGNEVIGTMTTSPGEAWDFSKGLNSSVVFVPGERMRFGSRVLNFAVHETEWTTVGLSSFAYVGDGSSEVGLGMGLSMDFLLGKRTRETGAQRPIIVTIGAGIQGFELNKSTGTGKFFIAAGISIGF